MGSPPAGGRRTRGRAGAPVGDAGVVGTGECLVHARFDFPFQIHSILFSLGRKSGASRR